MRKSIMYTMVMLLSLSIALSPVAALAVDDAGVYVYRSEPTGKAMLGDALVVRPLSMVCLAVTSVVFLVGWPFAAAGGNSEEAKQALLRDPVQYTFKRPLGNF